MKNTKKILFGKINTDDDPRFFQEGDYLNMENCRVASSDNGKNLRVENFKGTIQKYNNYPAGTNTELGWTVDAESQLLIWANHNSNGNHGIYAYDQQLDIGYKVLLSADVDTGLNFSKSYRIHSSHVINGLYYFTDNLNQLRRVNIKAGINLYQPGTFSGVTAYTSPLSENIITVIRKPPNYCLAVSKVVDGTLLNNFIDTFAGKFAAYFVNRDGEKTTLSGYSQLVPYNFSGETYNAVDVTMSLAEKIPQDVIKVKFCVQFGIKNKFYEIKTWDIANTADATAISNHNAGTTALTYRFLNDQTGVALSDEFSTKPYDNVAVASKTIAFAKNRLFTANNLFGYNTPTKTSLTASFRDQTSGTSASASVFKLMYNGGANTAYVIYIPLGGTSSGYYRVTANDTVNPSDPTAFASLTFISSDTTMVFRHYVPTWPTIPITSFTFQNYITVTGTPNTLTNAIVFKSASPYKVATWFFDRWMRKCGVIINGQIYQTSERTYSSVAFTASLDWVLSNADAVNEIPDWAWYYAVGRSVNLRTTYFLSARSKNTDQSQSMVYVKKTSTNTNDFTTTAYASTLAGVAVNITNLQNFAMGYAFTDGDICKIYIGASVYQLKITGQEGQWIICELKNLGTLNGTTDALFEIYTPFRQEQYETYFEVGQIYAITNPGTVNREYSVLGGSMRGDVYLIDRGTTPNNYFTENMSPNDKYYKDWFTDIGRINIIDSIGQQRKESNVSYSNVLIPGTKTNGLSSFDALDQKDIPHECGAIQKLQLSSKVQDEQGLVMLAICRNEWASMYLGEVQLLGSAENANVVQSTSVIGTINILKGSFGTMHPESVFYFRGLVFAFDVYNGVVVQYANNGLVPVSDYKLKRFFRKYSKKYLQDGEAAILTRNGFSHISACVDPLTERLLITLPATEDPGYCGTLPGYSGTPSYTTSIDNRYDFYDGKAKTIAFKYTENGWGESYEYVSDDLAYVGVNLYGFKNGVLYKHNADSGNYNKVYGVNYPQRICMAGTANPDEIVSSVTISVEGNASPSFTNLYAEYPYIQSTDLVASDYDIKEGVRYAAFKRDRVSPNTPGSAAAKLVSGIRINCVTPFVMTEFTKYDGQLQINFVNFGYKVQDGHKSITMQKQ